MSNNSSLGAFIRSKRTEKNLTQNELALLLSVSKSAVSKWERGVSYPDITIVSNLCRVLDIKEEDFLHAVNQKADEPAHEDCDALPVAPCPQERPSTLYSVLKWVFFGLFIAFALIFASKWEYFAVYGLANGILEWDQFVPLLVICLCFAAFAVTSVIFYNKTPKGEVAQAPILKSLAGASLFVAAIASFLYEYFTFSTTEYYHLLLAIGGSGVFLCSLCKKNKLGALFAVLPLILGIYSFIENEYTFSWNFGFLPLCQATLFALYIIKQFFPKAKLNLPFVALSLIFVGTACIRMWISLSALSLMFFYYSISALLYFSLVLFALSGLEIRKSFVTDAVDLIRKPAPFIAAGGAIVYIICLIYTYILESQTPPSHASIYIYYPLIIHGVIASTVCLLLPRPKTATKYQRGNI